MKPQLDAQRLNDLFQVNVDVQMAVQVGLGAAAQLTQFEPQLRALKSVGYPVEDVMQLRDRALALGHTHLEYTTATGTPDAGLVEALFKGRSRLLAHAAPLIEDEYFLEAAVAAHRGGFSHRDVAYNVIGLAGLYLKNWDRVQGLVSLKKAELEELRAHANDLLQVLSTKDQNPDEDSVWLLERQKAFTLFMRSYTEARHGVAFLRRAEGDLNELAPSLYLRKRRGKRDEAAGTEATTTDNALVEAADNHTPTATGAGAATKPKGEIAANPPPPAIPLGLPGSPPTFGDEP
jgi:hypothetical protein